MNLASITSELLKRLKRPQPQGYPAATEPQMPVEPPMPTPGAVVASQPGPKPIGAPTGLVGPDPAELNQLIGVRDNAFSRLGAQPPQPTKAKVDPYEATAAGLIALFSGGLTGNRAINAPFKMAEGRAMAQDEQNRYEFQVGQQQATTELNQSNRMIAEWYDRDTAVQKLAADFRKAEMSAQVKEFVQQSRMNTQLIATLAKQSGNGNMPPPETIKATLRTMDPGEDEDAIEAKAMALWEDSQKNPSWNAMIRRDKQQSDEQIAQSKLAETETKRLWDDLQNPNASFAQRVQLAQQLKRMGQLDPDVSAVEFAREVGAQTDLLNERAESEQVKRDQYVKESNARIDKIVSGIEKDGAQIEKWRAEGARKDRDFEWKKGQPGKPSALDNTLVRLRMAKDQLIAEADEWRNQTDLQGPTQEGKVLGPQQMQAAMMRIRREIAGIDAKIQTAKAMGAKDVKIEMPPFDLGMGGGGLSGPISGGKAKKSAPSKKLPQNVKLPPGVKLVRE